MKFFIDNWRWSGVPFYIRTGKRMKKRFTQIAIRLKKTPHHLFSESSTLPQEHNDLILRIQPDEEIAMHVGIKVPGAGFDIKSVRMNFKYSSLPDVHLPTAYERLLLDCMLGDATLYTRADAVEAAWAFRSGIKSKGFWIRPTCLWL